MVLKAAVLKILWYLQKNVRDTNINETNSESRFLLNEALRQI